MATFVFVHGSFLGARGWRSIIPQIEQAGHRCIALDLPAHGNEPTPPDIVTMRDYVQAVKGWISSLPDAVLLVGHSMTSIISQVAEEIPSRICSLVYVSGLLLPNG